LLENEREERHEHGSGHYRADSAEVDAILARHGAVIVPQGWLED
jgi:hypothetical protein